MKANHFKYTFSYINEFGVKDLGSLNGTTLNGEKMVPYKVYSLSNKDVIGFAKVHYTFEQDASA
ncbi:FHA domain-containing protein [Aureibacillus halotolerans]|uniref:FHA domain-containing protein n=1 Tax=Aureibacillus halotolerans TaxID=1508390 RepID=UPI00105EBA07|nr:FHA domain-containing protein [Aureibacillus halotolerans]